MFQGLSERISDCICSYNIHIIINTLLEPLFNIVLVVVYVLFYISYYYGAIL